MTFGPNVVIGGLCSPGSDENADVSFAEHVLEAAAVDNYVPARHSVFNIKFDLNSHHLSDTEAVAKVVEGVVPEAGASTETLFFVNLV